jgi:hypothetical protein
MFYFSCFRERLLLALTAISLGVGILSRLDLNDLLPVSALKVKLALWILASVVSFTVLISSIRSGPKLPEVKGT